MISFKGALIATLLVTAPLAAQRGGGGFGGGGGGFSGGGSGPAEPAAFTKLTLDLDLDKKTQVPNALKLFEAAQKEAAPVATEMVNLRQQMLNADMDAAGDTLKSVSAAHTVAATKMITIEAHLFSEIYAMLKPDQQKKAPKAFDDFAGAFRVSGAPARGGFGARGGAGAGATGGADRGGDQ